MPLKFVIIIIATMSGSSGMDIEQVPVETEELCVQGAARMDSVDWMQAYCLRVKP